ncbi:MAG: hypothetical protein ACLFTR_04895 [Candidatus Woesearchaeota archaeon]
MGFFDFMKKKDKDNVDPSPGHSSDIGHQQPSEDPFTSQQGGSPDSFQDSMGSQQGVTQQDPQFGQSDFGAPGGDASDQSYDPGYSPFSPEMSQQPPQDQQYGYASPGPANNTNAREQEIILSKLDAIRTAIQNLDHRLSSIETKLDKERSQKIDDTENIF